MSGSATVQGSAGVGPVFHGTSSCRARQRGMALAILVWFLAAMMLLVGTIVMQAGVDVKLAQSHANRARVEAAADGAIALSLSDWKTSELDESLAAPAPPGGEYTVGKLTVTVQFTPLSGLININQASPELLVLLFSSVGELGENAVQELADSVMDLRVQEPGEQPGENSGIWARYGGPGGAKDIPREGFRVLEDLMLLPGVDRTMFEQLRDRVYVSEQGQAGVDWLSAPVPVLQALGDMDRESALELAASREVDNPGLLLPDAIDPAFQEASEGDAYRVDAKVTLDKVTLLRRRWVNRGLSGPDGLPWRFFRTEPVRAIAGPAREGTDGMGEF